MADTVIVSGPSVELSPAYRPLNYAMYVNGPDRDRAAALLVQVKVNGTNLGDPIPIEHNRFTDFGGGQGSWSFFDFNIAERVQTFFKLENFWPNIAEPVAQASSEFQALVSIEVSTLYPDADGILQLEPTTISSQEIPVINAYRREVESSSLADFSVFTTSQQNPTQIKFLTRKPDRVLVSLDDTEFLGLWTEGLFSMRILSFDRNGVQQGDGQIVSGATGFGLPELAILPVGPANINAIDPGDWLANTGPVTIDEETKYYIIQAGWHCPDGSFSNFSEIRRYYIIPSGCRSYRVHFINSFGVPDSFSIFNTKIEDFVVSSDYFTSPVPPDFGVLDGGDRRVQASGVVRIKSPIGNVRLVDRRWLAREFSLSVDVRLEIGGQYIPAVLKDGAFPIEDSGADAPSITFTLDYAKRTISQRN